MNAVAKERFIAARGHHFCRFEHRHIMSPELGLQELLCAARERILCLVQHGLFDLEHDGCGTVVPGKVHHRLYALQGAPDRWEIRVNACGTGILYA
jgi:hypothetical protein